MRNNIYISQREWVNSEIKRLTEGKHISKKNMTKLLRKLWKQAKKEIR